MVKRLVMTLVLLLMYAFGSFAQSGPVLKVRTDKDVHFTTAISQNAADEESLSSTYVSAAVRGRNNVARGRVRSIRILSDENLAWEVHFYGNSSFDTTDADTERFLGMWAFVAGDAKTATSDSFYHYYIDGLDIAHESSDGLVHLRVINRSASAKTAGANGEMVVELGFEPAQ